LVRYCNQCAQAKVECEKRILALGGPNYKTLNADVCSDGNVNGSSVQMKRLSDIITDGLALSYFSQFLAATHEDINIKFWLACQSMRMVRNS
jgi:hypothetical protein